MKSPKNRLVSSQQTFLFDKQKAQSATKQKFFEISHPPAPPPASKMIMMLVLQMNWFSPYFLASDVVLLLLTAFIALRGGSKVLTAAMVASILIGDVPFHAAAEDDMQIYGHVLSPVIVACMVYMTWYAAKKNSFLGSLSLSALTITIIGNVYSFPPHDRDPMRSAKQYDPFKQPTIKDPMFLEVHTVTHAAVVLVTAVFSGIIEWEAERKGNVMPGKIKFVESEGGKEKEIKAD